MTSDDQGPAQGRPPTRPRRRPADDAPLLPTRSADDSDTGWGDHDDGSNDDRLTREVPPHW